MENGGEALLHGFPNRMELVTLDPSAKKNALYSCHLPEPNFPCCRAAQMSKSATGKSKPSGAKTTTLPSWKAEAGPAMVLLLL